MIWKRENIRQFDPDSVVTNHIESENKRDSSLLSMGDDPQVDLTTINVPENKDQEQS